MPTHPPADRPAPAGERIAKLLARAGVASRREVERMIVDGRVAIGGVAIDTPATVLRSLAGVTVDGQPVAAPAPARLFLYHKPTGLLVTERDPRGRPTIYDRLPADLPRVVPVGRLDLNTEGLLLLTTDGGLKRQLELPATGVPRTYRARAYGSVTQAALEELIHGVEIDGVRYGQIDANMERRTGANQWIELTLTEGKNREVRRVLEYLGLQVGRLIRIRYGPFLLADLPSGEVGEVRQHDLVAFRQSLTGKRAALIDPIAPAPRRRPDAAPPPGEDRRAAALRAPRTTAHVSPGEGRAPTGRRPSAPDTEAAGRAARPRPARDDSARPLDPGLRRGGKRGETTRSTPPHPGEGRGPAGKRTSGVDAAVTELKAPRSRATPDRAAPPLDRGKRLGSGRGARSETPSRPDRPPRGGGKPRRR